MSWWGKLLGGGFGFMLGGPLGALIGMTVGHQLDRGLTAVDLDAGDPERVQLVFFTATFSVMGYLAKTDGQVSKSEIQMAQNIMQQMSLNSAQRKAAIDLFNQGKQPDFPLDDILAQFKQECHRRTNLIQMFLEILIATAYADSRLDQAEHKALLYIAQATGFSQSQIEQLISQVTAQQQYSQRSAHTQKPTLDSAYAVLGVDKNIPDSDLKKAYRRLISQHHPDKLVSKGLPEEMIKLANEKTAEIKAAYDHIKNSRQ